jgi:GH24 family phage-related lysozyme (muramidase)
MNVDDYFQDLVQWEGCTTWMYCDVRGYVTVGIGNLLATEDAAIGLPFFRRVNRLHATDAEKGAGWRTVKSAYDGSKSAAFYRDVTTLRLEEDYVKDLVGRRLESEFIPGIKRLLHDFDGFPLPARKALVDLAYNLGVGGLAKFHHLMAACQERDWAAAAGQCHRSTSRDSRNAWTAQMFIDADAWLSGQVCSEEHPEDG